MNDRPVSPSIGKTVTSSAVSDDEVRRRIEELKRRPVAADTPPALFHYDPSEPLHLLPRSQKK